MSENNVISINKKTVKTVDPDRVMECVDHLNFFGFGYPDCDYCRERSEIAEQTFDFVMKAMIIKGRALNLDWAGLDLSLVFEEALERVLDIEQAISPETTRNERKQTDGELAGRSEETAQTSISSTERERSASDSSES